MSNFTGDTFANNISLRSAGWDLTFNAILLHHDIVREISNAPQLVVV